jgi:hypothetical protein
VSIGIASERGIISYMTDKKEDEAKALLDRLGTERKELEAKLDDVQKETHDAIVDILMARVLGPSEVARRVQYDRQHVARIAKKAGVPPLREATVVSRAKANAPKESRPAVAAPRRQVTQAVTASKPRRHPEPRDGRPLTDEEAKTLAVTALERASEIQGQKLRQITANAAKGYEDFAIVSSALDLGLLTHDEVYGPEATERPVSSEEKTA